MRISDWSSDVCSSDLRHPHRGEIALRPQDRRGAVANLAHRGNRQLLPDAIGPARREQPIVDAFDARKLDPAQCEADIDRKSVVEGKSVSVSVAIGGRRILKKKTIISITKEQ